MIDLVNLEQTTVSRDLGGKFLLIYGSPKIGKTSFAANIPNNLLLAFERGYQALPAIYVQDIVTWSDFKIVLRQLGKEEVKEKFKTITIDTADVAWKLCVNYICSQNGVKELGEIPWGRGWQLASNEFEESFRKLSMMGYGIVFISHEDVRTESVGENKSVDIIKPKLDKRAYHIINAMVDLIGYITIEYDEEGKSERFIYARQTPNIVAGTRFQYLPAKLPFRYENLVEELAKAIEKSAEKAGVELTDDEVIATQPTPVVIFEEIENEAKIIWTNLVEAGKDVEPILKEAEKIFGERKKLSEISPAEIDQYELLLEFMVNYSK